MADQLELKVNLDNCPLYQCAVCDKEDFDTVQRIYRVSKVLIGKTDDMFITRLVFKCYNCGEIVQPVKGNPVPVSKK